LRDIHEKRLAFIQPGDPRGVDQSCNTSGRRAGWAAVMFGDRFSSSTRCSS
jgi:hypothetical protein